MEALLASGGTAALFSLVIWLARNLLVTRLTKSVEHEYARLLESYKADLRSAEEEFKAELKAKELEISALRNGVLAAVSSRQLLMDKKRLEAAEEIWASVMSLGTFKFVSGWMANIKFEEAANAAKTDPNIRRLVEVLGDQFDPEQMKEKLVPCRARPFVTPLLWASYSAYSAVMMQAVMQAFAIKHGVDPKLITSDKSSEILKLVLPHQSDYIDKYGAAGYHYLIEEIEQKIIYEIHQTISGAETDEAGIKQAAAVIKKCSEVAPGMAI